MILELQKKLTYGPIQSRRLGTSLGINLFPGCIKHCSFDCVYCQFGWTEKRVLRLNRKNNSLPSPSEVEEAVRSTLENLPEPPAYLTFSGNGEPTLHPDFPEIVERIVSLKKEIGDNIRTAVLSNSSRVMKTDVRAGLIMLDFRIMKLDCGKEDIFRRYNRPARNLALDSITEGLIDLTEAAPVTIQSLFACGAEGNMDDVNASAWIERLRRIKPVEVQLYTLDRGYPASNLHPASITKLNKLAAEAQQKGLPVHVFY